MTLDEKFDKEYSWFEKIPLGIAYRDNIKSFIHSELKRQAQEIIDLIPDESENFYETRGHQIIKINIKQQLKSKYL